MIGGVKQGAIKHNAGVTKAMTFTGKALALTLLAMIAFAANSVLTRMALAPGLIDAASFSAVRIVSGAVMLWLIFALRGGIRQKPVFNPGMVFGLFVYVVGFSFAYLSLGAGTGALILFGCVQLTMLSWAFFKGERFSAMGWIGLGMALAGLVYLMLPGVAAPDPFGAFLMALAGVAWGVYSLLGRTAGDPLRATAWNFLLCSPLCLGVLGVFADEMVLDVQGGILAIASGALASGIGYVIWYAALPLLQARQASVVQLSVPVIAALGGALFISEPLTARTLIASALTLGGIALVLTRKA